MTLSVQPAAFSPTRALKSAGCVAVVGVGLSAANAVTGFGISCPWRALTGILCPFCGGTTLGVQLLHGDLAAAWASNPLVFTLLAGYCLAAVAWTVEALGGPALRPPARLRSPALWWSVFAVSGIGFALVRNLW